MKVGSIFETTTWTGKDTHHSLRLAQNRAQARRDAADAHREIFELAPDVMVLFLQCDFVRTVDEKEFMS